MYEQACKQEEKKKVTVGSGCMDEDGFGVIGLFIAQTMPVQINLCILLFFPLLFCRHNISIQYLKLFIASNWDYVDVFFYE